MIVSARTTVLVALASVLALPAAAQNQVVNPHFLTDLGGWTVPFNPTFYTVAHDASQGYNTPGSLRVSSLSSLPIAFVIAYQCHPVAPGQVLDFGGKVRFESGHAANLKGHASVRWFADTACSVALPFFGPTTNTVADVPNTWLPVHADDVPVPIGTQSAEFELDMGSTTGEGVGWFDDVYFGPAPLTPVVLLGFEVK